MACAGRVAISVFTCMVCSAEPKVAVISNPGPWLGGSVAYDTPECQTPRVGVREATSCGCAWRSHFLNRNCFSGASVRAAMPGVKLLRAEMYPDTSAETPHQHLKQRSRNAGLRIHPDSAYRRHISVLLMAPPPRQPSPSR
jgi:hypothetical protein